MSLLEPGINLVYPQLLSLCYNTSQVLVNRLLERCLRDSRCVDTESLCIVSGRKVWEVRIDIHVLNYDGTIVDAASIAAMAALCHFRRPDVTVCGEEITIHSIEERYCAGINSK